MNADCISREQVGGSSGPGLAVRRPVHIAAQDDCFIQRVFARHRGGDREAYAMRVTGKRVVLSSDLDDFLAMCLLLDSLL